MPLHSTILSLFFKVRNLGNSCVKFIRHHHYHHHHHHHHRRRRRRRRLYSPGWALASSSKCRQRPLSWSTASQFLQPIFLASSSTPSIYLDFGWTRSRWPPRFVHNIIFGNSFSSMRTTCPAHLNLLDFIRLTILAQCKALLILYCISSASIGPYTVRRIVLSKIRSLLSSFFVVNLFVTWWKVMTYVRF